jgi:acyl carrier protein
MDERRQGIERELERFIVEELLEERYDGRDPLATEAVDSLALEQLVEYIDEQFGVRLADEELIAENFESLPALATLVDSKHEM